MRISDLPADRADDAVALWRATGLPVLRCLPWCLGSGVDDEQALCGPSERDAEVARAARAVSTDAVRVGEITWSNSRPVTAAGVRTRMRPVGSMATCSLDLLSVGDGRLGGGGTAAVPRLLGGRLAQLPMDVVWHSPLPRAVATADDIAQHLPGVPVIEAPELVDHVPYVPNADETPSAWIGFFDGCTTADAAAGQQMAETLVARFGGLTATTASRVPVDTHELLVTHAYPIAWLVRHALDAPAPRWLGLESANAALTLIEHRSDLPPTLVLFNDMSHLPTELRWTGFSSTARP